MSEPVKFDRPPIIEVACGVLFANSNALQTAHIGAFWERVKADFPRIEDAAPLIPLLEEPGSTTVSFEYSDLPPLRRTWLLSEDGRTLIQLQQDRFLFNWKRTAEDDPYPSYDFVIKKFDTYLSLFLSFCVEAGLETLQFRQFELTYINHISSSNGLDAVGLSSLLVDHVRDTSSERFLPEPEGVSWTTVYTLPNNMGRLHISAQSAMSLPNQEKLVRLDLTARGIPAGDASGVRKDWFNLAHEWITRGFADITNPTLHRAETWGRIS